MGVIVGVAKETRWICAVDRDARVLFSHAVASDPAAIDG